MRLILSNLRYPFTAAEILASDNLSISNMFFRPKGKEDNKPEGEETEEVIVDDEGKWRQFRIGMTDFS